MKFNDIFHQLIKEYNLPADLSFPYEIPPAVQKIIEGEILQTELGITLSSLGPLRAAKEPWETRAIIEDNENHFHVDVYAHDEASAFKLGIKILLLLAEKCTMQKIQGVRLWYSFQTAALGLKQSIDLHFHQDGDEYFISDCLSFHSRLGTEEIISSDLFDTPYFAILIVDI